VRAKLATTMGELASASVERPGSRGGCQRQCVRRIKRDRADKYNESISCVISGRTHISITPLEELHEIHGSGN
jgi:hypothetical protein